MKVSAVARAATTTAPAESGPAEELLLAVAEVGRELASGAGDGDTAARLGAALRVLDRRLGAQRSVIYFADDDARVLDVGATHGLDPEKLRARYGHGVAGRVAESGQAVVVPVLRHDPMALEELTTLDDWRDAGWSVVAVPASSPGRRAILCGYFRHRDPKGFGERVRVLEVVSSLLMRAARADRHGRVDRTTSLAKIPAPTATSPRALPASRARADEIPFDYSNLVGASPIMRQVYEQIGQVARTTATALVTGESGTGKELVARAIHDNSPRTGQPFVKVNCAALPEPLFESELFGHERGAFTGAHSRRKGRFELAQGGTLFLDEIGELPMTTQAKLLRVLQFREFERLGGVETLCTDVRIVAATNNDLERAVREGRFREDLYYRINIFNIRLPSLAERRADIPPLAEYFLQKFAAEHQLRIGRFANGALDALVAHAWPGNVRELENVVQRAVVVCDDVVVQEHHLPTHVRRSAAPRAPLTLAEAVSDLERQMVGDALRAEHGNVAAAARVLGTTERIIRYKARKLGITASTAPRKPRS